MTSLGFLSQFMTACHIDVTVTGVFDRKVRFLGPTILISHDRLMPLKLHTFDAEFEL
jgi:hypothetical protein